MKQGMQTMGGQGVRLDQPQGYGANGYQKPKEEKNTIAMAGTGIINGQIPSGT